MSYYDMTYTEMSKYHFFMPRPRRGRGFYKMKFKWMDCFSEDGFTFWTFWIESVFFKSQRKGYRIKQSLGRDIVSLATASIISFSGIEEWLGIHMKLMRRVRCRRGWIMRKRVWIKVKLFVILDCKKNIYQFCSSILQINIYLIFFIVTLFVCMLYLLLPKTHKKNFILLFLTSKWKKNNNEFTFRNW